LDTEDLRSAAVTQLRAVLHESHGSGAAVFENVALRTVQLLGAIWRDVGLDPAIQSEHFQSLANRVLKLCAREVLQQERSQMALKGEHDDARDLVETHYIKLFCEGEDEMLTTNPLHERHAELQSAARQHLTRRLERLRGDLSELFGLVPGGPRNAMVASAQLALLAGTGAPCLPGRGDASSLLHPQDLDVLGLGGDPGGLAEWLRHPTNETFTALAQRQGEVMALLSEMRTLSHGVDQNLRDHYGALGIEDHRWSSRSKNPSAKLRI
jgi:hypothetical protein